jgi:hypothetical protein
MALKVKLTAIAAHYYGNDFDIKTHKARMTQYESMITIPIGEICW